MLHRPRPGAPRFAHVALLGAASALLGASCVEPQETDAPEPIGVAVSAATVAEAATNSCSTLSVKGLSEQIIAQGNCIAPGAFTAVPARPNLTLSQTVFPYLEEPAKDALVAALDGNPGTAMQINSMLRTVAQQYLLYYWGQNDLCGIGLAATPGNSNHETGLALDVQQYNAWKSPLQNQGFVWFGNSDPVHFDYAGAGAVNHKGVDVLAFQQLWNNNHPNDLLVEDGDYGPQTENRLKLSPAEGFPLGADCGPPPGEDADLFPSIAVLDAEDRFTDGGSMGVVDLLEGDEHSVTLTLANQGGSVAPDIVVGVWIEEPYLVASDYLIESDWTHPGTFEENDANTHADNPPHGQALGKEVTLRMNNLSPGETKRVTLAVRAANYSIGIADAPDVRFWVKDAPGFYQQAEFDGPSTNVGGSQSFNGGKLQVFAETDVYSRVRWEWDSDRLEGWSPLGDATLVADADGDAALLASAGADPGMVGPETSFAAEDAPTIAVRAARDGGEGQARLYFASDDGDGFAEERSIAFDLPDDGEVHAVELDVGSHPAWSGTITRLRLDPFASGSGTARIDAVRVRLEGGSSTGGSTGSGLTGGASGGATGSSGGDGDADVGEEGCACSAPGGGATAPIGSGRAALAILGLALAWRRASPGRRRSRSA